MFRVPPEPQPGGFDGFVHGFLHDGRLAHAEIVVAAPDHDVAFAIFREQACFRKAAAIPADVGELAVPALVAKTGKRVVENGIILHALSPALPHRNGRHGRIRTDTRENI